MKALNDRGLLRTLTRVSTLAIASLTLSSVKEPSAMRTAKFKNVSAESLDRERT
jgi:hypothetical protein